MSSFTTLLVAFFACYSTIQWSPAGAANILAVQMIPGKSHWNVMRAVLQALTNRGHNLTVFTPFAEGDRDGYTEVDVSEQMVPILGVNSTFLIQNYGSMRNMMPNVMSYTRASCDIIYGHPRMVEILDRVATWKFDLVITEPMGSECVAYVATVLSVPMVYVVPLPVVTYLERSLTGHIPNPAVSGHAMSHLSPLKTFAERFANVALTVHCSTLKWYAELRDRQADPRPYDAVDLARPSMIFINSHFTIEPARPLTSDVVQIGGIHLTPPNPIPKDILEFIDDAPHGVICLSFGSIVSMSSLPENVQSAFREAFARLPQKVLWKYEGEMKDKPKNVMTRKWFPQRDILLHPNVKLFISHGGISGVYESLVAGVPVLGCPFYNDQPRNIDNLVNAGMAIGMDLLSVTEDTLLTAILEIINNDRYQQNAKIASDRFKDRPMSPADSVVYWTEYVLRHNGAPHLKSHALNLTWYQYFLVDDILEFFEDAPHGVIYFTFSSVVSMASLPENVLSSLREALAQVPQKVLWKYEGEMEDKLKNVMTRKWFPQRDILMHPKLKLFISHGGISGVYEAVDAGVPILGFPFFYDQPRNIDNLVDAGMAISMDLFSVTKDMVLNAVLAIVNDDRYQKKAKIASKRFKDRPMSPAESVVYWTEYLLRHKGAPHLKSHAMNLKWYRYFLVDVTSAFLFVAFVVLSIIYCGPKMIYKRNFKYFYIGSVKAERE